jgi:hypothetical protein
MEKEIEELISDKEKFNNFVYTPLGEAIAELFARRDEKELEKKITDSLPAPLPDAIKNKPHAVLLVHLVTPSHEILRFTSIIDAIDELEPLFCEYLEDKFTDNNERKYSLGKMNFFLGTGKKGGEKSESMKVIDFDRFRGKKISDVEVLNGQKLIDFHHDLFQNVYNNKFSGEFFFDISEWYAKCGGKANLYYEHLLKIFLKDAILFENFLIDDQERYFTQNIFLPAFMKIKKEFGLKPLIVALEPTEIESDRFWTHYPSAVLEYVKSKFTDNIK